VKNYLGIGEKPQQKQELSFDPPVFKSISPLN